MKYFWLLEFNLITEANISVAANVLVLHLYTLLVMMNSRQSPKICPLNVAKS